MHSTTVTRDRRTPFVWQVRNRLSARRRQQARNIADRTLRPLGSIHHVETPERLVALTFDDGPDPEHTPVVLDALAARGSRATFFVLGDRVRVAPSIITDIVDAGHEVGLHGPTHERVTGSPAGALARTLRDARADLEDLTGRTVRWYRPPFGAQSVRSFVGARLAGLDVVVWSQDCRDWLPRPIADIASEAVHGLSPGRILLLHDGLVPDRANPTPPTRFSRGAMTVAILDAFEQLAIVGTSVGELLESGPAHRTAWFRP